MSELTVSMVANSWSPVRPRPLEQKLLRLFLVESSQFVSGGGRDARCSKASASIQMFGRVRSGFVDLILFPEGDSFRKSSLCSQSRCLAADAVLIRRHGATETVGASEILPFI